MSFLEETKNFGLVLMVISIISIVMDLFLMIVGFDNVKLGILPGLGSIIGDVLVFIYAFGVYKGGYLFSINRFMDDAVSKFGVLVGFVTISGIASIIGGLLSLSILTIIVGVLFLIAAYFMTDGKETIGDKVIWIILLVLFVLSIIGGVVMLFSLITLIEGVATIIEGIMLILMLLSPEVKSKMGM